MNGFAAGFTAVLNDCSWPNPPALRRSISLFIKLYVGLQSPTFGIDRYR